MDAHHIQGLDKLPSEVRSCVLTIGNFDGVHVGHRHILSTARALADAKGTAAVALTFDPPPGLVIRPQDTPERISPAELRVELLREAGADWVVTARTDMALLRLSPEAFVRQIICEKFAPRHVVEGEDFSFGAGRTGTVEVLRQLAGPAGFVVHVADPVLAELADGPHQVSSTLIRSLILAGRIEEANRCLGRPFVLYGPVVRGKGRGKELGFPTCNIDVGGQVRPAEGVYAGRAEIGDVTSAAAISIGSSPTFGADWFSVEAHLLDLMGEFYGKMMGLSFLCRLRAQEKFYRVEALKAQVAEDVAHVREICEQ